ncbi:MAG: hypothetical protein AAGK92_07450 [Pseudomonadota bacterium]
MKDYEAKAACTKTCWFVAGLAGGMVGLALWLVAEYTATQAIFMAVIAFLVLGVLLTVFMCRAPAPKLEQGKPAGTAPAPAPAAKTTPAPAPAAPAPAAAAPAPAAASEVAPAPKPKAASKPAAKPVAADGKPEMLSAPRAGGADDLKQIKGVGPKLEKLLHSMGFYHFDQIAGWRKKEVEWVDENLEGFKGRVSRDEWVKQAKVLAKGGETEFSKKVAKGGVYNG